MSKVLISVLGQDQPGIVAAMARVIADHHGNIENVSQTLLQDVFGALWIVTIPESSGISALREALQQQGRTLQLAIDVNPYTPGTPAGPPTEMQPYVITANGPDRNGLVAAVTAIFKRYGLNITNMHAAFTGGSKCFDNVMIYEVDVPRSAVMDDLRAELQEIAAALELEISIQHRHIFEAVSHIDR